MREELIRITEADDARLWMIIKIDFLRFSCSNQFADPIKEPGQEKASSLKIVRTFFQRQRRFGRICLRFM